MRPLRKPNLTAGKVRGLHVLIPAMIALLEHHDDSELQNASELELLEAEQALDFIVDLAEWHDAKREQRAAGRAS